MTSICKTEIHKWTVEAVEGGVRSNFRPFPSNGGNIDQLPFRSSQKWIQWTLTFTSSLSCIVAQASVKRWAASKGQKKDVRDASYFGYRVHDVLEVNRYQ